MVSLVSIPYLISLSHRSTVVFRILVTLFLLSILLLVVSLRISSPLSITKNLETTFPPPTSTLLVSPRTMQPSSNSPTSSTQPQVTMIDNPLRPFTRSRGTRMISTYPHLNQFLPPINTPLFRTKLSRHRNLRYNIYLSLGFPRSSFRSIEELYHYDRSLVQLVLHFCYLSDITDFFTAHRILVHDYQRQPYCDYLHEIARPFAQVHHYDHSFIDPGSDDDHDPEPQNFRTFTTLTLPDYGSSRGSAQL